MSLSREAIRGSSVKLRTVEVEVPELGGPVKLREMTHGQALALFAEAQRRKEAGDVDTFAGDLIVRCVVDDAGTLVFTDEPADVALVMSWPTAVVKRLQEAAIGINGLAAVENAAKN